MGASIFDQKEIKNHHNKQCTNCLSNLFFCWTLSSFIKGLKSTFEENDLFPPLHEHESTSLGNDLEQAWLQEKKHNPQPSLWAPLYKIFGKEFLTIGIVVFINEFVIRLSQPVLIWKLMTSYKVEKNIPRSNDIYPYIILIIISSFANSFICNWYMFTLRKLGMKMRIACSSLIYRKSLKITKNKLEEAVTGRIVNLLSNDLNRFEKCFLHMHYLWVAPIEAIIVLLLSYIIIDPSAIIGIALFFAFVPVQIYLGKKYSDFRLQAALKADERVRLINEMLSGIQVIKMYTWEKLFIQLANKIRKQEVKYIRKTMFLKAFQNALNKFLSKGAVFICVLIYILTGNHLQSQYIFAIKSFYNLLQNSMSNKFPEAVKDISEAYVSVKRIKKFLLSDEIISSKIQTNKLLTRISLKKVSAQWSSSVCDTLSEIYFEACSGQLVTIVGAVGSGKSSLINLILQELPVKSGTLFVNGKISYACQESWLFAGTVKENILFGESFNDIRYQEVVKVCALQRDFELLPYGDNTVVGDKGVTLSGGQKARINLARAVYRSADIYLLDDPLSAVDASVGKQLFNECILNYLKDKCVILVTHQLQYLQKSHVIYVMQNGKIISSGNYEQIQNSTVDFAKLLHKENECNDDLTNDDNDKKLSTQEEELFKEDKCTGKIPFYVYKKYLLSGGWFLFCGILIMFIMSQALQSGADYFESYWVRLEDQNVTVRSFFSLSDCLYTYSALIVLLSIFMIITSTAFFAYFMNVSIKLHDQMFSSVISATVNFFYANPVGTILNRFSKDIGVVDSNMPKYLIDTLEIGLNVLAVSIIIAIVNLWMLIGSCIMLLLFYSIRKVYLKTSREVKRIEAITRSPVYSHLNESLRGLETIRAFGVETKMKNKFDNVLNKNTSAFYMYLSTYTTFGFWLDFLCSTYLAFVAMCCFLGEDIRGEDMGLVMTQATSLMSIFQWGMVQWSEFENEMTSVERIIQYLDLEPERDEENTKPWPSSAQIQFKSVTLKYKENMPAALNDLNFTVASREKIGIVGRTGAGKTSIITTLFRLMQFEGSIVVGDVDIKQIPLQTLRSKISIIPQEPVLFSSSIRNNLDPFHEFRDSDLWALLEELDLKKLVRNLPAGLESQILQNGSNLSVGQKQLFCVARALLRGNKILVLDEATANVDFKTEALIQRVMKTKLVESTVLIIAHRLHTVMECDKVLVMDAGKLVEFDHPYKLLENDSGALYDLVEKTGQDMANHLKSITEKNYFQKFETTHL